MTWRERLTDEQLVAMAQHGDERAESVLVSRYIRIASMIARRMFRSGHDRADAMSHALQGLANAMRYYNQERDVQFKTFASLCMKRELISWIKSGLINRNQFNESLLCCGSATIERLAAPEPDFSSDRAQSLMLWLRDACSDCEAGVMRRFVAGWTYREIADFYGRAEKQVDNALCRVRRKAIRAASTGQLWDGISLMAPDAQGGARALWSSANPVHAQAQSFANRQHVIPQHRQMAASGQNRR